MKVIGIAYFNDRLPRPSLLLQARLLGSQIWSSSSYPLFWTTVAREQRWLFNLCPMKMQSFHKEIIITDNIFPETPSHPTACSLLAHQVHALRAPEPSLRVRVVGINYTCQAKCSLFQPVLKMKRIHCEETLLSKNTLQVHCFGKFFAGALFPKICCWFIVSKNTFQVYCFQKYFAGPLFPKILYRCIVFQK